MTVAEGIICAVVIIAATVSAIFNSLTPELAGILGVALGYVGKAAVTTVAAPSQTPAPTFSGAPED